MVCGRFSMAILNTTPPLTAWLQSVSLASNYAHLSFSKASVSLTFWGRTLL
jgi:hypothetical protein